MAKTKKTYSNLSQLGHKVEVPIKPEDACIETVPNVFARDHYLVRFVYPEFTCLCPVTGQPDSATLVVDYVPGKVLVESKSLKLYFQSFRNCGVFHEMCTAGIGKRLFKELKPIWLKVSGYWYPRGGMPIDVFFQKGKLPSDVDVPDTGISTYKGRI
ncbi:MAG: preQ(1) synthase [Alphaproteobacteria bacterium]|nr:preQ(1) synthase [Alphaproteobacteria bacterium]